MPLLSGDNVNLIPWDDNYNVSDNICEERPVYNHTHCIHLGLTGKDREDLIKFSYGEQTSHDQGDHDIGNGSKLEMTIADCTYRFIKDAHIVPP